MKNEIEKIHEKKISPIKKRLLEIINLISNNKKMIGIIILIFVVLSFVFSPYLNRIYMNEKGFRKITDKNICVINISYEARNDDYKDNDEGIIDLWKGYQREKIIILDIKENKQIDVTEDHSSLSNKIVDYNETSNELIYISYFGAVKKYNWKTKEDIFIDFDSEEQRLRYIADFLKIDDIKELNSSYLIIKGIEGYPLNLTDKNFDKLEYTYYENKFKIEKEFFDKLKNTIKQKMDIVNKKDIYIENIKKLNEDKYFVKVGYKLERLSVYKWEKMDKIYVKDYIYDSNLNKLTPLANYLVDIKDKDIWLKTYVDDRWTNNPYVERFIKESSNISIYDISFF